MDKQIDSKTCYGQYILLIPYFEIHLNFVKIEVISSTNNQVLISNENVKTFYVRGRRNAKYSLLDSKLNS